MNTDSLQYILQTTGAADAEPVEKVQTLWSGYGDIVRYRLSGCAYPTVIVKQIHPPAQRNHPRGWNTDLGHQRKLRSYQIESHWYQQWAQRCTSQVRVAQCLGVLNTDQTTTLILEDLDTAGFPKRKTAVTPGELDACLQWLAGFHACFMGETPSGLWPIGTYWHLDTRPEEWQAMEDGALKQAAKAIDTHLNSSHFQTLVHGDAKLENFCFSVSGNDVAAVDFQYVGGGCGMKDLAYFMSSCLDEKECERLETYILDTYFRLLRSTLEENKKTVNFSQLEQEWRHSYPVAWADFYRFLQGWMPGHWKIHGYGRRMVELTLNSLQT